MTVTLFNCMFDHYGERYSITKTDEEQTAKWQAFMHRKLGNRYGEYYIEELVKFYEREYQQNYKFNTAFATETKSECDHTFALFKEYIAK